MDREDNRLRQFFMTISSWVVCTRLFPCFKAVTIDFTPVIKCVNELIKALFYFHTSLILPNGH